MEYRSNLNNHLARDWASLHLRHLGQLAVCLLLSIALASGLIWLNFQKFAEIQPLAKEISAQKAKFNQQQSHIERLKSQTALGKNGLNSTEIADFIAILQKIPPQSAGLEVAQISQNEQAQPQLKFIGKYAKQQDFEQFQHVLAQFSAFTIKMDYLQSSEKYKAEFSLRLIPVSENGNENSEE
ncbi:hypothetical protein B0187_04230 [Haemophilus paracuniculus]|uniref:Uncharacterized protein n=1 Tax=Haemophilus paracuniculus TaxID=734 RepID=A0A1T0AUI2_9PAST|nr:hypothetical protein [Haemophilus paracuniculus]OOS00158.1 hypothetical protein B0187_04230 [Haemophilus paracuniculus]